MSVLGKARLWLLVALIGWAIVVVYPFADPIVWRFDGAIESSKFEQCIERDGSFGELSGFPGRLGAGGVIFAEKGESLSLDSHEGGVIVRAEQSVTDAQERALDRCTRLN